MSIETVQAQIEDDSGEQKTMLNMDAFITQLEPLLRRIVREELEHFAVQEPEFFHLTKDSPLYQDLHLLQERKAQGQLKLYSYGEVFGE